MVDDECASVGWFDSTEQDLQTASEFQSIDVLVLSFSVDSFDSLQAIEQRYLPSVRIHLPDAPVILCGTKSDLRYAGSDTQLVNVEEAQLVATRIGAACYIECTAKSQPSVALVNDSIVRAAMAGKPQQRSSSCSLM